MIASISRNKFKFLVLLLLITYAVGLFGILSPYRESFLNLSFYHLFVTFILLILSYYKLTRDTLVAIAVIFSVGFTAEWIGVHTHILFGQYSYGNNLGPKIWEVPLIIGINWALLSAVSCEMSRILVRKTHWRVILSAAIMVGMDFLIEPLAHVMDYWHWEGNSIPLFNFVCWFAIALGVNLIYFRLTKETSNYFSFWIFFTLLLFFVVLNIAL